ncbi:MAG: PEGA domain-containing protein, partial [Methanomicrobium sp.]|nr:PEGA domain-containing protein [Methanomicrobium sp.]
GYDSVSKNVYLNSGYTQNVYLSLGSPGSISVTSDPSDAYVSVNGNTVGKTPYVITGLSAGEHEVEVTKNGYYNFKKTVNVVEGAQFSVYAVLEPIASTNEILVTSEPSGAKIYLDGVYVGETMNGVSYPVQNVANGQHQLKLTLAGYSDYTTSVTMTGTAVNIYADMEAGSPQQKGLLTVSSTPAGAMIYMDDVYQGVITPYTISAVVPGEHTIMLRLSGYQDTYSKVTVYSGQTSTLTIGMSSQATSTTGSTTPVPTQSSPGFAVFLAASGIFAGYLIQKRD